MGVGEGQWRFIKLSSIFDDVTTVRGMSCLKKARAIKNRQFEASDINIIRKHLSRAVSSIAVEIFHLLQSELVCVCALFDCAKYGWKHLLAGIFFFVPFSGANLINDIFGRAAIIFLSPFLC
jgi:hypothetical protein